MSRACKFDFVQDDGIRNALCIVRMNNRNATGFILLSQIMQRHLVKYNTNNFLSDEETWSTQKGCKLYLEQQIELSECKNRQGRATRMIFFPGFI